MCIYHCERSIYAHDTQPELRIMPSEGARQGEWGMGGDGTFGMQDATDGLRNDLVARKLSCQRFSCYI